MTKGKKKKEKTENQTMNKNRRGCPEKEKRKIMNVGRAWNGE